MMPHDLHYSTPTQAPEPAVRRERPGLRRESLVVKIEDQLIVFRDTDGFGSQGPRCVAMTPRRKRCPKSVQSEGAYDGWEDWMIEDTLGWVSALLPGATDLDCFLAQRCQKHLDSDSPDITAPSWERFDPVEHAGLIKFHPIPTWTADGLTHRRGKKAAKPQEVKDDHYLGLDELLQRAIALRVDPPARTALYRFYDPDDRLLYVGISDHLASRHMSHVAESSWMEFAARSTIERHPTRREAADAELFAIKAEGPLFNRQHNESPDAVRRLVEYLIEHNRTDLLAPAVSRG